MGTTKKAETPRISSLPAEFRDITQNMLDQLTRMKAPPEAKEYIIRLVQRVAGTSGGDPESLYNLSRLISHPSFKPGMLGTIELVAERSGGRATEAFKLMEGILSYSRDNKYVLDTIRIVAQTYGVNTPDALGCVLSIVKSPQFNSQLNFSFPDKFIAFIQAATKSAAKGTGEHIGHALEALALALSNPQFKPADLNTKIASGFAKGIAAILSEAEENEVYGAIKAFGFLLTNPNINPKIMDEHLAGEVLGLARLAQKSESGLEALYAILIQPAFMINNLSLGHGIVPRLMRLAGEDSANALEYIRLLWIPGDPSIRNAATMLVETAEKTGMDGKAVLAALQTLRWAMPLVDSVPDFPKRFSHLVENIAQKNGKDAAAALGVIQHCFLMESVAMKKLFLTFESIAEMSKKPTRAVFEWAIVLNQSHPEMLDQAMIEKLVSLDSRLDQVQRGKTLFSKTVSMIDTGAIRDIIGSPLFRGQMLDENGIIGIFLRNSDANKLNLCLGGLQKLLKSAMATDMTPETWMRIEAIIIKAAMMPGMSTGDLLIGMEKLLDAKRVNTPEFLHTLESLITQAGADAPAALMVLNSLEKSKLRMTLDNNRTLYESPATIENPENIAAIARLARIVRGDTYALNSLMELAGNKNLTLSAFRHKWPMLAAQASPGKAVIVLLEEIGRIAGQVDAGHVFAFLNAALNSPINAGTENIMTPEMVRKAAAIVGSIRKSAGSQANDALADLIDAVGKGSFNIGSLSASKDYAEIIRLFGENAGAWAPYVVRCCVHVFSKYEDMPEKFARKLGNWVAWRLSEVPEAGREELIASIERFLSTAPMHLIELVVDNPELYLKGKTLADRLVKPPRNDPMLYANFAYAIDELGEQKTMVLYSRLGIETFYRYSPKMLDSLYENLDPSKNTDKPVVLVVFNKNDYNGSFYGEGKQLDALSKKYRVIIVETDSEDGFYDALRRTSQTYGRIGTLIIGGHGSPDSVKLGPETEKGMLDLMDEGEMKGVSRYFTDHPVVVLVACSTGKDENAIGAVMSKVWHTQALYAPSEPTVTAEYELAGGGELSVRYKKPSNVFAGGTKIGSKIGSE